MLNLYLSRVSRYWKYGHEGKYDWSPKMTKKDGVYNLTVYESTRVTFKAKNVGKNYYVRVRPVKGYVKDDTVGSYDDVTMTFTLPKKERLAGKSVKKTIYLQCEKVGAGTKWTGPKTKVNVTIKPLPDFDNEIKKMAAAEYNYAGDNYNKYDALFVAFDFIVKNVSYDRDAVNYRNYEVLLKGKGACESASKTLMEIALILGFPEKDIRIGESREENHAWVEVRFDKKWYDLDTAEAIGEGALVARCYEWFPGLFGMYLTKENVAVEEWDPNWRPDYTPGESYVEYVSWKEKYGLKEDMHIDEVGIILGWWNE